jgi:hypothetical protein
MTEQALLSLVENSVSLAILLYFVMYFKNRSEVISDRYMAHMEGHAKAQKEAEKTEP